MAASKKTQEEAKKARGWLHRIFPRKGKTIANQGKLGDATRSMRTRRKNMEAFMKDLDEE